MSKDINKEIPLDDKENLIENWQKIAQNMERKELEEAIFVELKVIQKDLRAILEGNTPKNS